MIPRIVVAIDFGTTFSGAAFAYIDAPRQREVISSWLSGGNLTTDKVLSEICYDEKAPNGYRWGLNINPQDERHRWFKLKLGPSQATKAPIIAEDTLSGGEIKQIDSDVDPITCATDFLTALRKHIMETLLTRYGGEFMEGTLIEYILTVPAVWPDKARDTTVECAKRAGMDSSYAISCVSEPEAAAIYCLFSMGHGRLRVGANYVVCDAGGGTVDLITYIVTKTAPLKVQESAVGDGGTCGSIYLNRRFELFLTEKLGGRAMERLRPRINAAVMKEFEDFIKRDFCDLPTQDEYTISVPGVRDTQWNGVQDEVLTITRGELREIFEPIVQAILELVHKQLKAVEKQNGVVAAVLLVGGFGVNLSQYHHSLGDSS
ncbi:hypothetical protein L873DRAFT_1841843 [Choiromyces venosus 120613-1]|uniref:Actin-like ATPase domain-containing protein n=1 Tax=Choiromyces venosus 120613-1 TaxID=1336337 RepID=A0A3N4JVF7_9PEZI|nr:hypothetical protein L873DRAFT_1841843 [Choiromyces venosus 120613-1]